MLPQNFFIQFNGDLITPHQITGARLDYEDPEDDTIHGIAIWTADSSDPFVFEEDAPEYQAVHNFLTNPEWTHVVYPYEQTNIPLKRVTYYHLSSQQINDMVQINFGKVYDCANAQGWSREDPPIHTYSLSIEDYSKNERKHFQEYLQDRTYGCSLETLLYELIEREILPEGDYLIHA